MSEAALRLAGEAPAGAYLDAYLAPFAQWLARETVTEIIVNRPGELWIEDSEWTAMRRIAAPEITNLLLGRLAAQVARVTHQAVNRERPLLAAALPGGARIQLCGPPATRDGWAMAIRRHRALGLSLESYDRGPLAPPVTHPLPDPQAAQIAFLREAVRQRRTILISGGTSSGKTTFLKVIQILNP